MARNKAKTTKLKQSDYVSLIDEISSVLESSRKFTARSLNAILTATYWVIGWKIIEFEQQGSHRAEYGDKLLKKISDDLIEKYGRGFSERNLEQMRLFY